MYKIKRFLKRIYNLYRWLPVIWKDQDWDDYYIFEILKFKLKNQAEYIGYHDRHVNAKRDAEVMMLCVRLIEKVQSEYYGVEYRDYIKSNLKFIPCKDRPDMYEMKEDIISENCDIYFKKYPRIYKQVMRAEKLRFRKDSKTGIAMNIAHINEERAHRLLFNILEQNIRKWWD